MKRSWTLTLAAALAVSALPLQSQAQTVSALDQDFIVAAGEANNAELAIARLALQQSSNDAVRNFAELLVADHTQAGTALQSAASSAEQSVPSSINAAEQVALHSLSSKSGEVFDVAFVRHMVVDHEAAIELFRAEAEQGTHEALRSFAATTLPALQSHLTLARSLLEQLDPGAVEARNDLERDCPEVQQTPAPQQAAVEDSNEQQY